MKFNNMDNFLITCQYGRAGSKFLATLMNRSKKWEIKHDNKVKDFYPAKTNGLNNINTINKRLHKNYYGEVCGGFYFHLERYNVNKKGIIIRNPINELISTINFNPSKPINYFIDIVMNNPHIGDYKTQLNLLNNRINSGKYHIINFDKMVSSLDYVNNILNYYNINDVTISESDIKKKINESKNKRINSIDDFSINTKNKLMEIYGDFITNNKLYK